MFRLGTSVFHMERTEAFANKLAEEVAIAIKEAGISQRELASKTGIPLVTLSRRLAATGRGFTMAELLLVADAVGVDLPELIARAEAATPREIA